MPYFSPPSALLRYNWQNHKVFKIYKVRSDICTSHKMIFAYHFTDYYFLVRTFMFYSLRKSQLWSLYNTVLSAVVTMLYIRFPDFANLITAACHPFANLSLFPPLFSTWWPLIYSLLLHTHQADLLWETSSCNQGSDLHPVSVCKLSPYSKSVILKPGCASGPHEGLLIMQKCMKGE